MGYDIYVIRGPSKASEYVNVRRQIAAQLQDEGCSYPTIGRALNRDHSTIVSLLKGGKGKNGSNQKRAPSRNQEGAAPQPTPGGGERGASPSTEGGSEG